MSMTPQLSELPSPAATAVEAQIRKERVVAILRLPDPLQGVDICRALAEAGLTVMEIAVNHPEALRALERARAAVDESVALGAGTVLDVPTVQRVRDCGGTFCVSPCLDAEVVNATRAAGLLPIPGVFSPTEVVAANRLGLRLLKLFPAEPSGIGYLRALRGPFPQIGFIPTGGIEIHAVDTWLTAGAVAVGLGSSLVGRGEDPAVIPSRAREILRRVEDAS